jgi:hypothetical protein
MQYWVYGSDMMSGEPRDPLFIEAENDADARAQAKESGMAVEAVEEVELSSSAPPPTKPWPVAEMADPEDDRNESDHPFAEFLIVAFRVMAGIVALLYFVLFRNVLEWGDRLRSMSRLVDVSAGASAVHLIVEGIVVVALLLATAEFLRLGIALERNTRGRPGSTKPAGEPGTLS